MDFTRKKGSVRVPNDEIDWELQPFIMESLFAVLMVELGFLPNPHRDEVWTHTKDKDFSLQLKDQEVLFEYGYRFESQDLSSCSGPREFVEQILIFTRESYFNNQTQGHQNRSTTRF